MLIEFSVKNFRSIKEEQTLSMVASSDKELEGNVFPLSRQGGVAKKWKDTRLLKSAVIYGANASGKSNLLEALRYICDQIGKTKTLSIDFFPKAEAFGLDADWKIAPSEFRIVFTAYDDEIVYEYYVKIHFEKNVVLEEKLDFFPRGRLKCLFHRTSEPDFQLSATVEFPGNNIKGVRGLSEKTAHNALFLSVAAAFNQSMLLKIRAWFSEIQSMDELGGSNKQESIDSFEKNPLLKNRMTSWLHAADLGIKNFSIINNEKETYQKTVFLHTGLSEGFIDEEQESFGTLRWFDLFLQTYRTIESGSLVFVDEICAYLHPLLVGYFVVLFHNPRFNPKNAQLICTTHHSSLLSGNILRRDQIWFAEKNGEGASQYYSLLDYAPRKDKAIAKGYLAGEYGAVPDLSDLDSLLEKMGL